VSLHFLQNNIIILEYSLLKSTITGKTFIQHDTCQKATLNSNKSGAKRLDVWKTLKICWTLLSRSIGNKCQLLLISLASSKFHSTTLMSNL